VEYSKVVENELYIKISIPIRNWAIKNNIRIKVGKFFLSKKGWPSDTIIKKFKGISLGNYEHLLEDKNVKEKFIKYIKGNLYLYAKDEDNRSLSKDIKKILELRNGCAHKETLTKEDAVKFREFLIKGGFIEKIINSTKNLI